MDLLKLLKELQKRKEVGHVSPTHILDIHFYNEVVVEAKREIDSLIEKGIIKAVRTVNNQAFYVSRED